MGSITLTLPVAGTQVTAGLLATDLTTLQTVINGNIDGANINASANLSITSLNATSNLVAFVSQGSQVAIGSLNTIVGGGPNAAGIALGSAADTILYRSAADVLRTDDTFSINDAMIIQSDGVIRTNQVAAGDVTVAATKKLPIYNAAGTFQGYLRLYSS